LLYVKKTIVTKQNLKGVKAWRSWSVRASLKITTKVLSQVDSIYKTFFSRAIPPDLILSRV